MKRIASVGLAFGLSMFASAVCADPIPPKLEKVIKIFQIDKSTLSDSVLRLRYTRDVVTRETFVSFIYSACDRLQLDPKSGWGNAKIERIETVNKIESQGFAFVGGRKACAPLDMFNQSDPKQRAYIAEHTWVCVAGNPCRPRRDREKTSGDQ